DEEQRADERERGDGAAGRVAGEPIAGGRGRHAEQRDPRLGERDQRANQGFASAYCDGARSAASTTVAGRVLSVSSHMPPRSSAPTPRCAVTCTSPSIDSTLTTPRVTWTSTSSGAAHASLRADEPRRARAAWIATAMTRIPTATPAKRW